MDTTTDATLEEVLASYTPGGNNLLDLTSSRLTALSLPPLLRWLQQHPDASVCVKHTNISLFEACRHAMAHMGSLEVIESHRLAFSANIPDQRALIELHTRAFMEGRSVGLDEAIAQSLQAVASANAQTAESMQRMQQQQEQADRRMQESQQRIQDSLQRMQQMQEIFAAGAEKLKQGALSLHGYHKSLSDAYEVLVTALMSMNLKRDHSDVYEHPRSQHKIPSQPPVYEKGVEWDGVLYVQARKHLYLIEAKGHLENSHITGMPARIQRTVQFIQLCAGGELPLSNAKHHTKQLCSAWASYAEADQVFGVVGAPGFTDVMATTANDLGLLAVFFDSGTHHMQLPQSKALMCYKTKQHVHGAISAMAATEEEILDALDK